MHEHKLVFDHKKHHLKPKFKTLNPKPVTKARGARTPKITISLGFRLEFRVRV